MDMSFDFIIAILTAITAIASCIAAIASWYGVTGIERHFRKVRRQRYDIMLLYKKVPDAGMLQKISAHWMQQNMDGSIDGSPKLVWIDGKLYCGVNLLPNDCFIDFYMKALYVGDYFESICITNLGRRRHRQSLNAMK